LTRATTTRSAEAVRSDTLWSRTVVADAGTGPEIPAARASATAQGARERRVGMGRTSRSTMNGEEGTGRGTRPRPAQVREV
jgi:hypothetical protein